MEAIYGLFSSVDSARRALATLRAESSRFSISTRITVISSEPLEADGMGWQEQRTLMPWLAVCGGIVGGTAGYMLAAFTQRTYPLVTGGMPIVSLWPSGIVMYELTMLGAILTTIVTFLVTAQLPRYRNRLYDPEVSRGKILVGVTDPDRKFGEELKQRLFDAGAQEVKEIWES
jgi:Protein of unknown function (DUF3341)